MKATLRPGCEARGVSHQSAPRAERPGKGERVKSIRTVGLACIAVLAMAASVGASVASASQFRAEEYPVTFTGQQGTEAAQLVLKTHAGKVKCNTATLSGGAVGAASTLSLTPSYSSCVLAGVAVKVNANGCRYVLHSTNESAPYTGTFDVSCAKGGEEIEISDSTCLITVPAQSGLGSMEFSNSGKGRSRQIAASFNVSGIKHVVHSGCPNGGGTFETGTQTGTGTISGASETKGYALGAYVGNEQIEEPPFFKAESYPSSLIGKSSEPGDKPLFSFAIGKFNCAETTLSGGVLTGASSTTIKVPAFTGCTLAGVGFEVKPNSCAFRFTLAEGGPPNTAGLGITCETKGDAITFYWGGSCVIKMGEQEHPQAVHYENTGTGKGRGVHLRAVVSGVTYEQQSGCLGGSGTFNNGSFETGWQLSALDGVGTQQGLWIE